MESVFHPAWTTHYRPLVATSHLATVRVTRATGTGSYNPETRQYEGSGTAETVYEGKARWQKVGMTTKRHTLDDYAQFNRVRVVIMMEEMPAGFDGFKPNDKVTLLENPSNPSSEGSVVYFWGDPTSSNAWHHTLNCQQNMKQVG